MVPLADDFTSIRQRLDELEGKPIQTSAAKPWPVAKSVFACPQCTDRGWVNSPVVGGPRYVQCSYCCNPQRLGPPSL